MEIRLKTKFYRPDGTLDGSVTYARNDVSTGVGYNLDDLLISRRIPDGSLARINVEVWEEDCGCFGNDDDYYGQRNFIIGDRGQTRSIIGDPAGGLNTLGDLTNIRLDWTPKPAPVASSMSLTVSQYSVLIGGLTSFSARVIDQYGYAIPGAAPSSWTSYQPNVLDLTGSGGGAYGTGMTEGGAVVAAAYGSIVSSAYITVTSGGGEPPCPNNQIQCEPTRIGVNTLTARADQLRRP
jgi:hypothetical protein